MSLDFSIDMNSCSTIHNALTILRLKIIYIYCVFVIPTSKPGSDTHILSIRSFREETYVQLTNEQFLL